MCRSTHGPGMVPETSTRPLNAEISGPKRSFSCSFHLFSTGNRCSSSHRNLRHWCDVGPMPQRGHIPLGGDLGNSMPSPAVCLLPGPDSKPAAWCHIQSSKSSIVPCSLHNIEAIVPRQTTVPSALSGLDGMPNRRCGGLLAG
jgi:hypothetical protein